MKKISIIAAAMLACCLGLTACSPASIPDTIKVENQEKEVITVGSRETVRVVPDIAEITFAVYTQAEDAQACQTQNNEDLDRVLEVLNKSGIEEKSIQTSGYGLSPTYDWESGKTITGYEMTTEVTVSDLPIDQVGLLLTTCVNAGINSIQSVDYMSSQYDEQYQEALKKAVDSARIKAEAIAEAGGCKLGGIVHVEEYGNSQSVRYTGYRNEAAMAAPGAGAVADKMAVKPGEVEVDAQVSVEFAILGAK